MTRRIQVAAMLATGALLLVAGSVAAQSRPVSQSTAMPTTTTEEVDRRLDLLMNLQLASLVPVVNPTN